MSLGSKYNDILLSELLLEHLKDGEVPFADDLLEEFEELQKTYPRLGERPLFRFKDSSVAFAEESSASKTNEMLHRYTVDSEALWETIEDLEKEILSKNKKWSSNYLTLRRTLESVEDRIDSLLLMEQDTLGYFNYVSDDFLTVDSLEMSATTAFVDTTNGIISVGEANIDSDDYERIDLGEVQSTDVGIQASGSGLVSSAAGDNFEAIKALSDENTQWLHYVQLSTQGTVTVSYVAKLPETKTINRVSIQMAGSTAVSGFTVSLFYSSNGVDYDLAPTTNSTQLVTTGATWTFPEVEARFIKLLITKAGADDKNSNGNYVYEIGLKLLALYKTKFNTENTYLVESTPLSVLDGDGNKKTFQKVACSVCESLPEDTDILYYVSVDNGATYLSISPLERENATYSNIIDFSDAVTVKSSDATVGHDSTLGVTALDYNQTASYTLTNKDDGVTNFYISSSDVDNLDTDSIVFWRNTGEKGSETTVRGKSRGWSHEEEGFVSTVVDIRATDGLQIDFGSSEITINDVTSSGVVTLTQGRHTIKTTTNNWLTVVAATDLDDLKSKDSLYPYNHKLLIEGYSYPSGWTDEKTYAGADVFAEGLGVYEGSTAFSGRSDTDRLVYSRTLDNDGNIIFLIKINAEDADYINEKYLVEYKLRDKTFDTIVFRAKLQTNNAEVSPALEGFLLKLG